MRIPYVYIRTLLDNIAADCCSSFIRIGSAAGFSHCPSFTDADTPLLTMNVLRYMRSGLLFIFSLIPPIMYISAHCERGSQRILLCRGALRFRCVQFTLDLPKDPVLRVRACVCACIPPLLSCVTARPTDGSDADSRNGRGVSSFPPVRGARGVYGIGEAARTGAAWTSRLSDSITGHTHTHTWFSAKG